MYVLALKYVIIVPVIYAKSLPFPLKNYLSFGTALNYQCYY